MEENRLFILDAAEAVFAQKGFTAATMDDIAERAQFSKATLYRYFESKLDIFDKIILQTFEDVLKRTKKIRDKETDAASKLKELFEYVGSQYQKKMNIVRVFFIEMLFMKKKLLGPNEEDLSHTLSHPPIPEKLKVLLEDISLSIQDIIRKGIDSGEFRTVDPADARIVFGAMVRGFHMQGPFLEKTYSMKESTELLHSFFLHGIQKAGKAG